MDTGLLRFTADVLAILVVIDRIVTTAKNWRGSPELKSIDNMVSIFMTHISKLDETLRILAGKL